MRKGTTIPMDDNRPTNEGRFGNRGVKEYSGWAAVVAMAIIIVSMDWSFIFQESSPACNWIPPNCPPKASIRIILILC